MLKNRPYKKAPGWMSIASCRLDVPKEDLPQWCEIRDRVLEIHNDVYKLWWRWHSERGNDLAVRAWRDAYVASVKEHGPKGKHPKCPVMAWPGECAKWIRDRLLERFPAVHVRVIDLTLNKLSKTIRTSPSTRSAFGRWLTNLFGRGETPEFSNGVPIPFDRRNSTIGHDGEHYYLQVAMARDDGRPVPARPVVIETYQNTGAPKEDRRKERKILFELERIVRWQTECLEAEREAQRAKRRLNKAGDEKAAAALKAREVPVDEERFRWRGSNVVFSEGKRRWFAQLFFEMPGREDRGLDRSRVAYLNPAVRRPITLWIDGKPEGLRFSGRPVKGLLFRNEAQRRARQRHYQEMSSAGKGRGRRRATRSWVSKLSRNRQNVLHNYNGNLAANVVRRCVRAVCGSLVFYKPVDRPEREGTGRKATRFLTAVGNGSWDWTQLEAMLRRRCEREGVAFERRDVDGSGRSVSAKSALQFLLQLQTAPRVSSKQVQGPAF